VFDYFAHKRDFGATFGIGFMKTTKQTPYWIYFLNQGFFSKNKFVAPYPLEYRKVNEMVITIDRKIGILTYWVKGTDHVLVIKDD